MTDFVEAFANYALIILIIVGIVAFVKIALLVWFFCELVTLRKATQRTAKAVSELSKKMNPKVSQNSLNSSVDELIRYKKLVDIGALTEQEFEFKKSQILGRNITSFVDISSN